MADERKCDICDKGLGEPSEPCTDSECDCKDLPTFCSETCAIAFIELMKQAEEKGGMN